MSSAAIEIVERSLAELRTARTTVLEELRKIDKLIDDQVKSLDRFRPKAPKPAVKKDYKPEPSKATIVTLDSRRKTKSAKHSAAGSKGGRPTKKVEFMKWLRENKAIAREKIPTQLSTSVQKTNEFVPELVREGLVKLEDRGDKHDPIEFVVITEAGLKS